MVHIAKLHRTDVCHSNGGRPTGGRPRFFKILTTFALTSAIIGLTTTRVANGWTKSSTQALVFSGFNGNENGIGEAKVRLDDAENMYVLGRSGGTAEYDNANPTLRVGNNDDWSSHLIKYSREGAMQWKAEWFEATGNVYFEDIEVTGTGDVYLSGYAGAGVDLDPGSSTRTLTGSVNTAIIIKLNSSGVFQWVRELPATDSFIKDLAIRSNGSLVIGGKFTGTLNLNGPGGPGGVSLTAGAGGDGFVASLTSAGVEQWAQKVTSSNFDDITSVDVNSAGDVFASGVSNGTSTFSSADGSTSTVTIGGSLLGTIVWKLNAAGNTQWVLAPEPTPTTLANRTFVIQRSGGTTLVATDFGKLFSVSTSGTLTSTLTTGGFISTLDELSTQQVVYGGLFTGPVDLDPTSGSDTKSSMSSSNDAYLTTLSSSLGYVSTKVWDGALGEELNWVTPMSNGGFVVVGRSFSTTPLALSAPSDGTTYSRATGADSMRFIVRYNSDGTTTSSTTTTTTTTPPTTTTVPAPSAPSAVAYSPGNGKVTLRWSGDAVAVRFEVLNASGQKICESTVTSCAISKLKNGKLYTMKVRAFNASSVASAETSIRVIPGFALKKTSYVAKQKPSLSSILTTPSTGKKSWSAVSGGCRIAGGKLVTPSKKATCKVALSVTKTKKYPAMKTTISVAVTK